MTAGSGIQPGGECDRCHAWVDERVTIAIVETGSGPGGSAYGCLPCARIRATGPYAPDWLVGLLDDIDARRGTR
ncbi:hypothetical protein [Streptomyces sp. Z26]|uniref:hypothetical protein n=1 Tax=Streptomyces sp. Z26 TaxID=2500177 RepID=UPI000EF1389F|nr:hypothetical protein [Streptomyces sp. Z26]RLL62460.1 hypothetical protein D7M15_28125 [Streptomyces sp. Z26]RLL68119.1 hypothetical protein D7M15_16160 [Streptomyces sp. Z26]